MAGANWAPPQGGFAQRHTAAARRRGPSAPRCLFLLPTLSLLSATLHGCGDQQDNAQADVAVQATTSTTAGFSVLVLGKNMDEQVGPSMGSQAGVLADFPQADPSWTLEAPASAPNDTSNSSSTTTAVSTGSSSTAASGVSTAAASSSTTAAPNASATSSATAAASGTTTASATTGTATEALPSTSASYFASAPTTETNGGVPDAATMTSTPTYSATTGVQGAATNTSSTSPPTGTTTDTVEPSTSAATYSPTGTSGTQEAVSNTSASSSPPTTTATLETSTSATSRLPAGSTTVQEAVTGTSTSTSSPTGTTTLEMSTPITSYPPTSTAGLEEVFTNTSTLSSSGAATATVEASTATTSSTIWTTATTTESTSAAATQSSSSATTPTLPANSTTVTSTSSTSTTTSTSAAADASTTTSVTSTTVALGASPSRPPASLPSTTSRPPGAANQLSSFRNCYLPAPLRQDLGCQQLEVHQGPDFGLNAHGQDTTGRRKCLDRVRAVNGDTFVFSLGECEVWRCGSREVLRASTAPPAGEPAPTPIPIPGPAPAPQPPIPAPQPPSPVPPPPSPAPQYPSPTPPPASPAPAPKPSPTGQIVSFGGWNGKYLRAQADKTVTFDGDLDSPEVRFELTHREGVLISLRSQTGYITALPDGRLLADRERAARWEKLGLIRHPTGNVSLMTHTNLYVSARPDGQALANQRWIREYELLSMVEHPTATMSAWSEGRPQPAPAPELPPQPPAAARDQPAPAAVVVSELCEFEEATGGPGGLQRRAPIFVKLWEWNYVDVARECEDYLGPNGFDAVQLSPVVEHIRGPQWWTKYQPVSFSLNTRSGTAEEFKSMVARCRAAGVEVIADLILNHIAGGCPQGGDPRHRHDPTPCTGWSGSKYGHRRINGSSGWDSATPELFRHPPGRPSDGICGVGAPDYLCGSLVTTDCSCCKCDLYGLPDWNTDLQAVQDIHYRHLEELNDLGVTMLRIDASLYEDPKQLSMVLNRFPWNYIFQEWWGEFPVGIHDKLIGNYRDVAYRWKICNALAGEPDVRRLPELLDLSWGVFGISPEKAVYPMCFHDQRTDHADPTIASYKNGLEYHQQQKFMMVWPNTVRIILWGGFGYTNTDQGPPGCEHGEAHKDLCTPTSVFDASGAPDCLPTPTESPLPEGLSTRRGWVCEHRWAGVAGLVGFRKACRGLPVAHVPDPAAGAGRLAFRVGEACFVALVRGANTRFPHPWEHLLSDWPLQGLQVGLPPGRYCDVASLPTRLQAGATSCPREVVVGTDGAITSGTVVKGDLLAIYTGGRLEARPEPLRRRRKGLVGVGRR